MVSTRSQTAETQTKPEDSGANTKSRAARAKSSKSKAKEERAEKDENPADTSTKQAPANGQGKRKNLARKRKSPPPATKASEAGQPFSKKRKPDKSDPDTTQEDGGDDGDIIMINRSPVLQLWAACVAQFLHPDLDWETCVSAGHAVASICAVAKGHSIGTIEKGEETEEKRRAREERREAERELDELEIMQFKLRLKSGKAVVSGKPASGSDAGIRGKFGERYDGVKKLFEDALETWKGDEEELNGRAFGMYEDFRPGVPKGQGGWGRKGELRLSTVEGTVRKGDA